MTAATTTTTTLPDRGRGLTTIAPRVVEKVATRAAAQVPGAHAASVSGYRSLLAPLDASSAAADAHQTSSGVRLQLHLDVEWPAAVGSIAERACDAVRAAVLDIVGLELESIEVSIESFVHPDRPPLPRVQ